MRKLIVFAFVLYFCATMEVNAQNRAIEFEHTTWNLIVEKAKKEKKLIFMDAFAEWCGPCKWMAANTFTNDAVADYYNTNFVCAKIDMEKGEGPNLKTKFEVKAYPTLLYIDPETETMVHKLVGGVPPDKFLEVGKAANNPNERLGTYQKKYEEGKLKSNEMTKYIKLLGEAYMDKDAVLTKYLGSLSEKDRKTAETWNLLKENTENIGSEAFNTMLKYEADYSKIASENEVQQTILNLYSYHFLRMVYRNFDETKFDKALTEVKEGTFSKKQAVENDARMSLAMVQQKWDEYVKYAVLLTNDVEINDSRKLNEIAWNIFENSDDEAALKHAVKLAENSVKISEGHENLDTYANLLFKTGNKEKAIEMEKKAIELAKANGAQTEDYETTLERMLK